MFPNGFTVKHYNCRGDAIWMVGPRSQEVLLFGRSDDNEEVLLASSGENVVCYHGTSLTTALLISTMGFKAGPSTDDQKTGVFCVGPDDLDGWITLSEGFLHARDRAKCFLCSEWNAYGAPSCWSMPVVIAFQVPKSSLCTCGGIGDARKWVIQGEPGEILHFGPIHVLFDVDQYHAWHHLHKLCELPWNQKCLANKELFNLRRERILMCGGKRSDPFFWCRDSNNCYSSCGRVCAFSNIPPKGSQSYSDGVVSNTSIWRCARCYFKHH